MKKKIIRSTDGKMHRDNAERVVEGARNLGECMFATKLMDRLVVVRELMPQDLKLEIETLTADEAVRAARYLASVVGEAYARQMDGAVRWQRRKAFALSNAKTHHAPSWLWTSVVDLVAMHEGAYLEHCRRHAALKAA